MQDAKGTTPLFTLILPPKITSVSHEALTKWKKERREYESRLRARCRVTGEVYEALAETILESFDPDLLDTFCELKLGRASADVTEGMLIAEIDNITSSIKNDTLPDIKTLFKKQLKLKFAKSDVEARVIDYFNDFGKIMSENGLVECFEGAEGEKEKCKRLIASLHPEALRNEVKQCTRFTHKPASTNSRLLYNLILKKAKEHNRQFLRLKQGKDKERDNPGRAKPPQNKKTAASNQAATGDKRNRDGKAQPTGATPGKPTSKPPTPLSGVARGPPSPCPKCKELHWLRDCTKAAESEKEGLKKKMRAAKDAKRSRLKRLGECFPKTDRTVTINGVLELPCCPDTGSDFTIMGPTHWEQLRALDPSVETKILEIPIRNQTFGSRWVTADKKACLRVMTHTAVGPVQPMNEVDVLIVDADDDEFIIGNDLLTLLGIDVHRQLEQLARRNDGETSGDPVVLEPDETPATESTTDSSESDNIFAAVEKMIERAVAHGFPTYKVELLRTIVHAYDVWRLEFRGDPAARVPPLEVRLRNGALPAKCKPRKYPPHIRQFLHEFNARLVELGLVYENPNSRWSSPVLPVKKSNDLMDLRQTTDYRAVNGKTEAMAAVMPILSLVMEHARGMKHFGLFDFIKGFCSCRLLKSVRSSYLCLRHKLDAGKCRGLRSTRSSPTEKARYRFGQHQAHPTSSSRNRISLNEEERAAFDQVKELLATSATLDFPDATATTCLFTDASDVGWAAIVTQVDNFDPKLPATQQQHILLQCMSGTFTGSQLNWTVIEKEAFPIKHVRGKLLRWAIKLMNFLYIVQHVPGSENVWADMISRWAGNHVSTARPAVLKVFRNRETSFNHPPVSALRPLDDDNFIWPTLTELMDIQSKYSIPADAVRKEDGLIVVDDRIWIPPEADDLILRLCIVAHCGARGHRGHHAMVNHLRRLFSIDHLSKRVATFLRGCLLCLHSREGEIVPRPWSETIDCATRNGVLHFDFLYMGESYGDSKYLLVLKDHATHFCELVVADSADSRVVVDALLDWYSRFGLPPLWVSDNGTHFKNEVISELCRRLRIQQTFTPAYCPWVNGSIERVNRDILQVVRAMILSYKVSHKAWVYLVPMIMANLNHTAVPSLGNRAPIELFTGLQCPSPLMEFYLPEKQSLQQVPPSKEIDNYLDQLRTSLQQMHQDVEDRRLKQRLLNKKHQRGESLVNFTVGGYVLHSRVDEKHGNKLQVTWVGPYRVVRTDTHSFRVQHLITGKESDVHASRLKLYADDSLEVTDELLEHVASQGIVLAVNELKDHRWNESISDFDILVGWKGLQSIEDSYEPMQGLATDIPVLIGNYVTAVGDPQLHEYWQKISGVSATEPQPSAPPTTTTPSESDDITTVDHRHRSRRKRRRQTASEPEKEVPQCDPNTAEAIGVPPQRAKREIRRTVEEESQRHTSVGNQDTQPLLGRRTRSMTVAAEADGESMSPRLCLTRLHIGDFVCQTARCIQDHVQYISGSLSIPRGRPWIDEDAWGTSWLASVSNPHSSISQVPETSIHSATSSCGVAPTLIVFAFLVLRPRIHYTLSSITGLLSGSGLSSFLPSTSLTSLTSSSGLSGLTSGLSSLPDMSSILGGLTSLTSGTGTGTGLSTLTSSTGTGTGLSSLSSLIGTSTGSSTTTNLLSSATGTTTGSSASDTALSSATEATESTTTATATTSNDSTTQASSK
ncbi:unnamed protein product [Phytophthora fragariaefolia]|uniref:Unnamed protein product n=1 Tax=Phytophthora fragariaefolia TaxID=1490495 RepID=A0A9W7D8R5_9STRA|nr:unnamed protein product [Phytophthora fragariaefolia]